MTNKEFSKTDEFKKICADIGVEPTKRQASKYRLRIRRWKFKK